MGEDEDTPLVEVVGIYNKMHPQDRVRVLAFFEKAKRGKLRVSKVKCACSNSNIEPVELGTYECGTQPL